MTEPSKDELEHQLFQELTKAPDAPTFESWDTMVRLSKLTLLVHIEGQILIEHDPERAADLHALSEILGRFECN